MSPDSAVPKLARRQTVPLMSAHRRCICSALRFCVLQWIISLFVCLFVCSPLHSRLGLPVLARCLSTSIATCHSTGSSACMLRILRQLSGFKFEPSRGAPPSARVLVHLKAVHTHLLFSTLLVRNLRLQLSRTRVSSLHTVQQEVCNRWL